MSSIRLKTGFMLAVFFSALLALIGIMALAEVHGAVKKERAAPSWHLWGPGSSWRHEWEDKNMTPRHRHRMQRHWLFMNGNIPSRYQSLKNPQKGTEANILKGQAIYETHCANCQAPEDQPAGTVGAVWPTIL